MKDWKNTIYHRILTSAGMLHPSKQRKNRLVRRKSTGILESKRPAPKIKQIGRSYSSILNSLNEVAAGKVGRLEKAHQSAEWSVLTCPSARGNHVRAFQVITDVVLSSEELCHSFSPVDADPVGDVLQTVNDPGELR